jgi:hypothetical protein
MSLRFCILAEVGDLLDGGELHYVEGAQTIELAKQRIEELAESKPGQYIIYNQETGERIFIVAGLPR